MKRKRLLKPHLGGNHLDKDGVVVDANIMSEYYQESIKKQGKLFDLINYLLLHRGIAISMIIEREWKNTTGNQVFNIWFDDQLKLGLIGYVNNPRLDQSHMKRIHNEFGLPRRGHDIEYIKTANMTSVKYIVTKDIDLFDPKKKRAAKKEKDHIKKSRNGMLCNYLRKKLTIRVGLPEHCYKDLVNHST